MMNNKLTTTFCNFLMKKATAGAAYPWKTNNREKRNE